MPGPKMGARPHDFDESIVRKAPTFLKWQSLPPGAKLRYACRDFTKGKDEDEERLMRRIMIARRNNLRDHEMLKRARKRDVSRVDCGGVTELQSIEMEAKRKKLDGRKLMSDEEVKREMDVVAVEGTRSYKAWMKLKDGAEFIYNQRYVKGRAGHDFLLKKNIWRRMRYRRQNKKMVEKMKTTAAGPAPEVNININMDMQMPLEDDCDHDAIGHEVITASHHEYTAQMIANATSSLIHNPVSVENSIIHRDASGGGQVVTPMAVLSDDHVDTANQAISAAAASSELVSKAVVDAAVAAAASYVNNQKHLKSIANPLASAAALTAQEDVINVTDLMMRQHHHGHQPINYHTQHHEHQTIVGHQHNYHERQPIIGHQLQHDQLDVACHLGSLKDDAQDLRDELSKTVAL
mmetsp:Transcript_44374/g.53635  ORF Transcript_44374/g.53635 Transcript_44374/m.53635 type:complete len:407 (+) Transcript_44374:224-1444(+)|eukprot:CAMPEP_0172517708 /NCGR_PEP_ID=MMETSP1066-20121228/287263_1 /TAXON_ID=671091 /ORGANISM="Coscinodiscus wailesii, Strain CCMP2513" /LENGTH=406 /DNA_ID=CAMNT_0013299847 /DNA_START=222 /DNA_END=1442 /DNA_ORIENTATION=-